ncbi:MAG: TolC family protein [Geminicoccaceae bacterium]
MPGDTAVYRDQEVLALALNNEQRLQRQLEATRDRFQVGEVARTDVAQAEARLARARRRRDQGRQDLAASRALSPSLREEPRSLVQPPTLHALPAFEEAEALAANSPDVLAATFALYAARDDVDVNSSTLLPSVDLQAEVPRLRRPAHRHHELEPQRRRGRERQHPALSGRGRRARARLAPACPPAPQRNRDHAPQRAGGGAAWERLLAATAAIEAFKSEVRANRIALEGVQQEALVGFAHRARRARCAGGGAGHLAGQSGPRAAQRVASYQLKLAVGQLTVSQLNLVVQPLRQPGDGQQPPARGCSADERSSGEAWPAFGEEGALALGEVGMRHGTVAQGPARRVLLDLAREHQPHDLLDQPLAAAWRPGAWT